MSSSTSRLPPLELPELVAATLQYITDPQDLRSCILVNKLWASEATTLLWEKDPPISAFVDLPAFMEPERLQIYAKKVRKLTLNADEARYTHLFKRTQFPRLETLVLDSSAYNVEENLLQFFQPSLRNFHIYGGPIGDTLLKELQTRNPHLEELLIDNPRVSVTAQGTFYPQTPANWKHPHECLTAEGFLTFLTGMPSLKGLLVMYGMDHAISNEVLHHLAERASLVRLDLGKLVRRELAHTLVDSIPHPFEHLQTLTCSAEGKAFKLLAPHLLNLETLRLSLLENIDTILSAIARCPKITHVEVEYPTGTVPPPSEILHLAEKHRNLTTLELHWSDDDSLLGHETQSDPHSINDADMEKVASLLTSVERLVLLFPLSPSLSSRSLESVGKHCKGIKCLKLFGIFSLIDLPQSSCLFPQLLELVIQDVDSESGEMAEQAVRRLRSHAPKLEEFEALQNDVFSDQVMNPISYPAC